MKKKISYLLFRIIRWCVWLVYPKIAVVGAENLPDEPVIVVGNHTQMNGPITSELYFPGKHSTWCAGQMMHLKEVPAYAFEDFWSFKPKYIQWFYRIASYIIAPVSVCVFNNAATVPVYRDARIITTYRESIQKMEDGASMVIFPEYNRRVSNILYDFQDKFIDLARFYYKKTGKELSFVPMYIAPALRKMYLGKPVRFCADTPIVQERARIKEYLMQQITEIACSLPPHTVVPYRNIGKKNYPLNLPFEAYVYEETSSELS